MERAPTAPLDLAALGLKSRCNAADAVPTLIGGKGRRRPACGVRVEQLREYPVRSLVFEAGDSLQEVIRWPASSAIAVRLDASDA
jgi:hypothetical protein